MEQRVGRWLAPAFLILYLTATFVGAAVNPTDLGALNVLSSAWGASTLKWTSGDPCTDRWLGVGCDATNTQVVSLILASSSIIGTIPAGIGSFSGLQHLDLSFNPQLQGSIPSEIGKLTTLHELSIQSCNLTGPIPPSLGDLKNLTFLALNNNHLTGELPYTLGKLQKVYWLDVATNNLTGPLPVSSTNADAVGLDTMEACEHFHLNNNSFSGSIPPELGQAPSRIPAKLTKLKHMLFESNRLTGPIPDSLGNLTSLEILSLSDNQLSGPIPAGLTKLATNLTKLNQLLLGHNQLTGTIPDLGLGGHLIVVDVSYNSFDPQPFPTWPQNAANITTLYMQKTNLVGNFSDDILSHGSLQTLWASNNSLNGTLFIPASIGPLLTVVSLESNLFNSIVRRPSTANWSNIEFMLSNNPVCSADDPFRPAETCENELSLPSWPTPQTVRLCKDVSCPTGLTLNPLSAACACADSFQVQVQLRRPTFRTFTDDLMENLRVALHSELNLQSRQVGIERGVLSPDGRADISVSFFGADGASAPDADTVANVTQSLKFQKLALTGYKPYILNWVEASQFITEHKHGLGPGAIAGIVLGAIALLSAVGVYAILQKRRARKLEHIALPFAHWGGGDGEKDVAAPQMHVARWFSFAEIKKATNHFSADNEIGEGGYGKVYSGVLASGERVAVKRAAKNSMQGAEEFKNEIELLSRVHHKNLVGLVGYCYDKGEQMLVYEFMNNGTILEWLGGKKAYPLDWSKRLSIAIGSARGLAYLHEMANPPIVHRDIKSSNILLDDKHIAKVADFGLSKLAPDGTNNSVEMTQVKGTLGYLDPEYYMTQKLSEKSDVYSFGVVLLELLTSKTPISHGRYIVREMKEAYREEGMEGLEPALDPAVHETSPQDLQRLLDLAFVCTENKGDDRPTMNEVVKELEELAHHNKAKAKVSALATDETWMQDVYGDDGSAYPSQDQFQGIPTSFQYSGGYMPHVPLPK